MLHVAKYLLLEAPSAAGIKKFRREVLNWGYAKLNTAVLKAVTKADPP